MTRSESRVLTELVGVRFTPEEHAALVVQADASGCTVPELLRLALRVYVEHRKADPDYRASVEAHLDRQRRILLGGEPDG